MKPAERDRRADDDERRRADDDDPRRAGAEPDAAEAMEVARRAVHAAASAALEHWRSELRIEYKPDGSPVTSGDHAAESAILAVLRDTFPHHGILSEESGVFGAGARSRWIVDPIDGTRGFARGGTFWGPLVAFERDGRLVAGAMALPALGETYWAGRGCGAFCNGMRLELSAVDRWQDATLSLGQMRALLEPRRHDGVLELVRTAASTRCYGDLAACAQLLRGQADAWLEAGVQLWDLAALKVLVEEAGGRVTDFEGGAGADAGQAVATNGRLHDHVLAVLGGHP